MPAFAFLPLAQKNKPVEHKELCNCSAYSDWFLTGFLGIVELILDTKMQKLLSKHRY